MALDAKKRKRKRRKATNGEAGAVAQAGARGHGVARCGDREEGCVKGLGGQSESSSASWGAAGSPSDFGSGTHLPSDPVTAVTAIWKLYFGSSPLGNPGSRCPRARPGGGHLPEEPL